jgi:hypothetical protein
MFIFLLLENEVKMKNNYYFLQITFEKNCWLLRYDIDE